MEYQILIKLQDWFIALGLEEKRAVLFASLTVLAIVLFLSWVIFVLITRVVLVIIKRLTVKSATNWDNIFFEQKVFTRLSHLVPAILLYHGVAIAMAAYPKTVGILQSITYLYMIIAGILVVNGIINSMHEIYNSMDASQNRSIKSYVQVVKIFVYIMGLGIAMSVIFKRDLTALFAGIGAMAAVIMLVFKDSILGLVAGIQLSANDMVRLGDWIQMPSRGADGDVIDISLNTVKVQNWDKTISTIPTYALVSESFTNWRGMQDSGGRRIKRSINIDMRSIHFLTNEEIEKLRKIQIIRDYIDSRQNEVKQYNKEHDVDESMPVNGRRLTNIGTFRFYIEEYLKRHPKIHQDMTFLIRHLQPDEKGLPIEIYVFSNNQEWVGYEGIQSDIFDHILAVIPHFGLRVHQSPTGNDIASLADYLAHGEI